MGMNKNYWPLALPLLLLLSACGGNPAWSGPEESDLKVIAAAEQACQCIYEAIELDEDADPGTVLGQLSDYERALKGEDVAPEDYEAVNRLLGRKAALASTVDNGTCMQAVEDDIFNKGLDFEDMLDALDEHCALSIFYD